MVHDVDALRVTRAGVGLVLLAAAAGLLPWAPAGSQAASPPAVLTTVGNFSSPTDVTAPPGDAHRVFVVQKAGLVRIVKDGTVLPTPFVDLRPYVVISDTEQGLLSIAFPPDYATSHVFYAYFTGTSGTIHVWELRVASASSDVALDPAANHLELFAIPHPTNTNHNGGQLMFGPDGDLYIGVGDGGGAGDVPNNAQNLGKDLGKILRVKTTPGVGSGWVSASGQPFSGALPEIWAYGLRNPWRFSFDPATGTLVIGDVGQDSWEEVDALPAGTAPGLNLGWHYCEGTHPYTGGVTAAQCLTTYTPPVFEYPHTLGRCSITGGVVVRDPAVTALDGRYIYGDFCGGDIHSFTVPAPGQGAGDDAATGLHVDGLDSFGVDGLGHVYAVSLNGPVYRLDSPGGTPPPPPGGGGGGGGGPAGGTHALSIKLAGVSGRKLRAVLRRGLVIHTAAAEAARCTAAVYLSAGAARRLGIHVHNGAVLRWIAGKPVVFTKAGTRTVTLRISAGRAALHRAKRALLLLRLGCHTPDGRSAKARAAVRV
jgi:glucose/arabinose dehydrogenase